MNITCKFKALVYTRKSYPHALSIEYALECEWDNMEDIMRNAAFYLETLVDFKDLVSEEIECLGCTFIHHAMLDELKKLDSQGLKRIDGNRLSRLF